jgi:hypothetical protein
MGLRVWTGAGVRKEKVKINWITGIICIMCS